MSVTQDQFVDFVKNLKLSEVKELITRLEDELGVSASAPVVVGGAAPVAAAAAAEVEQTEFDVILTSAGEGKIGVIKVVRELTGLGLKEAKALVDGAPAKVKEGVSKADADDFQKKLEAAGASVEIK